jgi:branched-chain amino acid transport system substrate-binding protein
LGGAAVLTGCSSRLNIGSTTAHLPAGPDLVIGASLELTGSGSLVGKSQRNAIEIAQDKINSNRIIVNNRRCRVQVLINDNGSDPKKATALAEQYAANTEVLAIIGGGTVVTATAMAQVAEEAEMPLIATTAADTVLKPITNRRFVFKLGADAADVAAILAKAISDYAGRHVKVMVMAENGDYGNAGVAAMQMAANNAELRLMLPERVAVGANSYFDRAERAAGKRPDAIVVWAVAPTSGLAARALRTAGYAGPIFFDTGAASQDALLSLNRGTSESYIVAPSIIGGRPLAVTNPIEQHKVEFFQQYTRRFGTFAGASVPGADAINLVAAAAKRARSTATRLRIRDGLEAAPYDGLAGQYIFSTTAHGGMEKESLALFQMRGADWFKIR